MPAIDKNKKEFIDLIKHFETIVPEGAELRYNLEKSTDKFLILYNKHPIAIIKLLPVFNTIYIYTDFALEFSFRSNHTEFILENIANIYNTLLTLNIEDRKKLNYDLALLFREHSVNKFDLNNLLIKYKLNINMVI